MRSAMCAASQLSGRGPLVWMLPLYLHVNQKSDYDDVLIYRGECTMSYKYKKKFLKELQIL